MVNNDQQILKTTIGQVMPEPVSSGDSATGDQGYDKTVG